MVWAAAQPALVVAGRRRHALPLRQGDQRRPLFGCFARHSPAPDVPFVGLFKSRACKWLSPTCCGTDTGLQREWVCARRRGFFGAVRSRSEPNARSLGPARVNRLRLGASAARTARPCGESLLELAFQPVGRDVMFGDNLHRDLDPDPCGLEGDDLHVVGQVLPVRVVIALAFFKRIFTRSLPMNQAHGLIIAEVTDPVASARTRRSRSQGSGKSGRNHHRLDDS
jgi:hypothetical protein